MGRPAARCGAEDRVECSRRMVMARAFPPLGRHDPAALALRVQRFIGSLLLQRGGTRGPLGEVREPTYTPRPRRSSRRIAGSRAFGPAVSKASNRL